MEGAEGQERRYNTRFRGVPKSVFSPTKTTKKSASKTKFPAPLKTDLRDDFIYTKLSKKKSPARQIVESTIKNKESKRENSPPPSPPEEKPPATQREKPTSQKNEQPISHKNVQPRASQKSELRTSQKNELRSSQRNEQPTLHKNDVGTTQKNEQTTPIKKELCTSPKNEYPESQKDELTTPKKRELQTSQKAEKPPSQNEQPAPKLPKKEKPESHPPEPLPKPPSPLQVQVQEPPAMPPAPAPEEKPLSNGVHHSDTEPGEEPMSDGEKPLLQQLDIEDKEDPQPTNLKIVPTVKEFVVSGGSNSKSVWITSKEKLSFNNCNVASYNPKTKMFRCVICQAVGFMTRIGEHYLGTHCNTKVFQCPQCPYCSAWWRCVRNHMSKHHGISNAPASMWKNQPLLDEIMQLLQNLKYSVDCEDRVIKVAENSGKRYICPKCPYATDRRDLYNRHENIHREEKPFQCYICYKLFNRADHVKKHFCRIHKDYDYDINLIRRLPSKRSRLPVSQHNGNSSPIHHMDTSSSTSNIAPLYPAPNAVTICTAGVPVVSQASSCQSKLLNCLTGPPTMVRLSQETGYMPKNENIKENPKENAFQELPSSLLNYLTRPNFPSKPPLLELPPSSDSNNSQKLDGCCGKQLQEGVIATFGYPQPHSNNSGSMPKEFICPYCPWKSTDMWALRMHTATHYNNACVLCNFRSTKESDMEAHMWDCHRKRPCNKCDFLADSIMVLDAHMKDMHSKPSQQQPLPAAPFKCRVCSQPFGSRSDMEAHSIFVHNQILRGCKNNGCDFCSTDPEVLQEHTREKHCTATAAASTSTLTLMPSISAEKVSASRTQCLYCGCDFADNPSLCLHEEIFHENPLQIAGRRPLDPYSCSVCGYATPKQLMMMEHLRVHTGQELLCRAGDGCHFSTPYDTVLREHVLQSHSGDDGIVRCPHCGLRCSTRKSFTSHYEHHHHLFCCTLCEEVEHKYFVSPKSSSYLDSTIAALFPFAKKVSDVSSKACKQDNKNQSGANAVCQSRSSEDAIGVETGRRSRKQSQPRKIVLEEEEESEKSKGIPSSNSPRKRSGTAKDARSNSRLISLYTKRARCLGRASLLRCWLCAKRPLYFRQKRNFVFHVSWHRLRRQRCSKCVLMFRHRYQVLLHTRREHRD